MNLNLSPEQFLAVYNSVAVNQNLTAQEVKSKMDLIMLEALSLVHDTKNHSKFETWLKQQSGKISVMKDELESIKQKSENIPDDGLYFPVK